MLNRAILIGRLTRDPEVRTVKEHKVCNFSLAVKRPYADKDQVDFISCVAWSYKADLLDKYTKKGDMIGIDGFIITRSFETKDGQKVNATEIQAESITLLNTSGNSNGTNGNTSPKIGEYANENDYTSKYTSEPKTEQGGNKTAHSVQTSSWYQPDLFSQPVTELKQQPDPQLTTNYRQSSNSINIEDDDLPF